MPYTMPLAERYGRKQLNNAGLGEHVLIWNGENSRGNRIGPGMYFLKLSVIDSNSRLVKSFNTRMTYIP